MGKSPLWIVAGAMLAIGSSCAALTLSDSNGLFPAEREPTSSGVAIVVRVGPAANDAMRIKPVTFLSRSGINPGEGSKAMCGLIIAAQGRQPQGVITVGTGVNDATPSCDAVLAVGTLPAARGEKIRRIGVIHAVSSRNAAGGRAAVVLRRNTVGRWLVDDDATARADTMTNYTIAELRRRLR